MRTQATRRTKDSADSPVLYMAFELGHKKWLIRFGDLKRTRDVEISARDVDRMMKEVSKAKEKFGLAQGCRVRSCYEAGWDGFWLDRFLQGVGIENLVVDPASIEVNRRFRRVKTDRIDVGKLHGLLVRHARGEKVWSVVCVPSPAEEDSRHLQREWDQLRKERNQHRSRIESLLVTQGVVVKVGRNFERILETLPIWDGSPVRTRLRARIDREMARLRLVEAQIRVLRSLRAALLQAAESKPEETAARLVELRGIGPVAGWTLSTEFFGWREFRNGKEVGSLAGLTPTPYSSGTREREQGIDKAGNGRVRRLMVQLSWKWLLLQPESSLSLWYRERFAGGGGRMRKVGIVALARKLLVALWHYLEHGIIPEGAEMKPARP